MKELLVVSLEKYHLTDTDYYLGTVSVFEYGIDVYLYISTPDNKPFHTLSHFPLAKRLREFLKSQQDFDMRECCWEDYVGPSLPEASDYFAELIFEIRDLLKPHNHVTIEWTQPFEAKICIE